MVNWSSSTTRPPSRPCNWSTTCVPARRVTSSRGAVIGSWQEAERVLAGFPDGHADEGPAAGPASLAGLELAARAGLDRTRRQRPLECRRRCVTRPAVDPRAGGGGAGRHLAGQERVGAGVGRLWRRLGHPDVRSDDNGTHEHEAEPPKQNDPTNTMGRRGRTPDGRPADAGPHRQLGRRACLDPRRLPAARRVRLAAPGRRHRSRPGRRRGQGLGPARAWRRGLPDRDEVGVPAAARREAPLPAGQRRRVRAGHVQGHPADAGEPAHPARGRHRVGLRDPGAARVHLHPR